MKIKETYLKSQIKLKQTLKKASIICLPIGFIFSLIAVIDLIITKVNAKDSNLYFFFLIGIPLLLISGFLFLNSYLIKIPLDENNKSTNETKE